MTRAKWLKTGSALILTAGILGACGDAGEPEEVNVPELDDDEEVEEVIEEDPDAS